MPIRVYYEVLNQKGTPALYSDNYAQRPAAGYQGRIFNSPDTGQIFYDTGTTWTLLADAGVGSGSLASVCANGNTTATGISITAGGLSTNDFTNTGFASSVGYVWFAGTGGQMTGTQSFFWDNNNKWLGLGTNTPTAPFDIHTTGNIGIQINNTTTADSKIAFLNADVGKWRIGNLYSGGANLFHIYNNAGATLAMQINSSNAALFYGSLSANNFIQTNGGISLIHNSVPTSSGYTGIGGLTAGLSIALASGFNQTLTFPTGVAYTYTFPSATGTIALTSNLGGTTGYLPKYASGTSLGQSLIYDNGTNVGIGTSSPAAKLEIPKAGTSFGVPSNAGISISAGGGVGEYNQILFGYSAGDFSPAAIGYVTTDGAGSTKGDLVFGTRNVTTASAPTIRMRITSGGVIYGLSSGADGNYQPTFGSMYTSNNNETNAISTAVSSVGSQSGFRFEVSNGGGSTSRTNVFWITRGGFTSNVDGESVIIDNNPSNSGSRRVLTIQGGVFAASGDSSSKLIIFQSNNGTELGSVRRDGGSGVSYLSSSDYRLKEDLKDYDALSIISNIKTYDYKWKDVSLRNYGVMAHELQEIVPYAVGGVKDEVDEDNNIKVQGVDYSKLVPITIKAIQQLDQRLTTLENLN